jgi:hypothetical protein
MIYSTERKFLVSEKTPNRFIASAANFIFGIFFFSFVQFALGPPLSAFWHALLIKPAGVASLVSDHQSVLSRRLAANPPGKPSNPKEIRR